MSTVRWNIAISPDVQSVCAYLLEQAAEQAKAAAEDLSESQLNDLIDEAVQWAREH